MSEELAALTLSLPQPVNCPGWKLHGRAWKQYIFRSYLTSNIYFQCYALWWKSFHTPVRKRRQKGLKVLNFAHFLVVFEWHHGSEGVKITTPPPLTTATATTTTKPTGRCERSHRPYVHLTVVDCWSSDRLAWLNYTGTRGAPFIQPLQRNNPSSQRKR